MGIVKNIFRMDHKKLDNHLNYKPKKWTWKDEIEMYWDIFFNGIWFSFYPLKGVVAVFGFFGISYEKGKTIMSKQRFIKINFLLISILIFKKKI